MKIKSIEEVSPRTVYAVTTSTGTYIADGLAHHNCGGCNLNPPRGKGGNYVEYFIFMEQEWGRPMIDEFRALKNTTIIYKVPDLLAIKEKYDKKYEELISGYNH